MSECLVCLGFETHRGFAAKTWVSPTKLIYLKKMFVSMQVCDELSSTFASITQPIVIAFIAQRDERLFFTTYTVGAAGEECVRK